MSTLHQFKVSLIALVSLYFFCPNSQANQTTITVSTDDTGDCKTIQEAIQRIPSNSKDRTIISIKAGTYLGQIVLPKDKINVTFLGDISQKTILTYNLNANEPYPETVNRLHRGAGTVIESSDFIAENITFENTSGDHGQAMALRVEGDRAVIRNCRLLGWQDTLLCHGNRQYFDQCYIEGRVDFIYGASTAVFDHCEIHSKNGGYITAASTPADHMYGFVFMDCKLTGDDLPWKNPSTTQPIVVTPLAYLGRPWRPYANVMFIHCEMGKHIRPEGWDNWRNPDNEKTARYTEYDNSGEGAISTKRVNWCKQLTPDQAKHITIEGILAGTDGWNPLKK